jgi:uracil-DNA glycosylase
VTPAFAEDLADAVTRLVGKYHDQTAEQGRKHQVVVAVHPSVKRTRTTQTQTRTLTRTQTKEV